MCSCLLSLPATKTPELPAEREVSLGVLAEALVEEAKTTDSAAAVLTVFWFESHLDQLVHAGVSHPRWSSDRGRAACMGQLHRSKIVRDWDSLSGTDLESTRRCVAATLRVLRSVSWACGYRGAFEGTTIARVFAAYGRGRCPPPGMGLPHWPTERADWFDRARAKMARRRVGTPPPPGEVEPRAVFGSSDGGRAVRVAEGAP